MKKKIIFSILLFLIFTTKIYAVNFTKEYVRRVNAILINLGITYEMVIEKTGGKLQYETDNLVSIGKDIFGREQFLTPNTAKACKKMINDAKKDGVNLYIVSAFRTIDHQEKIIEKKLNSGMSIKEALTINAIPGFSEHHTGRAIDFHTDNVKILDENFEKTKAYSWLVKNANKYGFRETYPKGNTKGIEYEPWHWYYFRENN